MKLTSAAAGAAGGASRTGRVDSGIMVDGSMADACIFSAGAKRGCTERVSGDGTTPATMPADGGITVNNESVSTCCIGIGGIGICICIGVGVGDICPKVTVRLTGGIGGGTPVEAEPAEGAGRWYGGGALATPFCSLKNDAHSSFWFT